MDGTALTATWSAPAVDGGSAVERYQVTWTVPGRRDVVESTGAGTLAHTIDVGDVPPGTVVTVTVRAENASGRGDPASATWTVPTPPAPGGDG